MVVGYEFHLIYDNEYNSFTPYLSPLSVMGLSTSLQSISLGETLGSSAISCDELGTERSYGTEISKLMSEIFGYDADISDKTSLGGFSSSSVTSG